MVSSPKLNGLQLCQNSSQLCIDSSWKGPPNKLAALGVPLNTAQTQQLQLAWDSLDPGNCMYRPRETHGTAHSGYTMRELQLRSNKCLKEPLSIKTVSSSNIRQQSSPPGLLCPIPSFSCRKICTSYSKSFILCDFRWCCLLIYIHRSLGIEIEIDGRRGWHRRDSF